MSFFGRALQGLSPSRQSFYAYRRHPKPMQTSFSDTRPRASFAREHYLSSAIQLMGDESMHVAHMGFADRKKISTIGYVIELPPIKDKAGEEWARHITVPVFEGEDGKLNQWNEIHITFERKGHEKIRIYYDLSGKVINPKSEAYARFLANFPDDVRKYTPRCARLFLMTAKDLRDEAVAVLTGQQG